MSTHQSRAGPGRGSTATVQTRDGATTIAFPGQAHPISCHRVGQYGKYYYSVIVEDVSPFAVPRSGDGPRYIFPSESPTPSFDDNDARNSDSRNRSIPEPRTNKPLDELTRLKENNRRLKLQMQQDPRIEKATSALLRATRDECINIANQWKARSEKLEENLNKATTEIEALQRSHVDLEEILSCSRKTFETRIDNLTEVVEVQKQNTLSLLQGADHDRQKLRESLVHYLCIADQQYAMLGLLHQRLRHLGQRRIFKPAEIPLSTGATSWTSLNVDQRRQAANVWFFDTTPREIQSDQLASAGIDSTELLTFSENEEGEDGDDHVNGEAWHYSDPDAEFKSIPGALECIAADAFDYSRYRDGPWIFIARSDPLTAAKFMHEACYDGDPEDPDPIIVNFAERWSPRGFASGDSRAKDYSLCLRSTLWWSLKRESGARVTVPGEPKVSLEVNDHIYSPNVLVLAKKPTELLLNPSRFRVQVLSTNCQTTPSSEIRQACTPFAPSVLENKMSCRIMRALQLAQRRSDNIILPAYGGGLAVSKPEHLATAVHTALKKLTRLSRLGRIVIALPPSKEFDETWAAFEEEFEHDTNIPFCQNERHLFITMMEESTTYTIRPINGPWANMTRGGIESVREWMDVRDPGLLTRRRMTRQRRLEVLQPYGTLW